MIIPVSTMGVDFRDIETDAKPDFSRLRRDIEPFPLYRNEEMISSHGYLSRQ